jgi:succinate dehydrogenase/fumarate reductase flavoprotein subunit
VSEREDRPIVQAADIGSFAETCDVLVVGSGSAGTCAAIEAAEAGAQVLILECRDEAGGSSAMASGQLYLGGGTSLQKACGFDDSADALYDYLMETCGPGADPVKTRIFADRSTEHFEWVAAHDVPFKPTFLPHTETTNPPGDDGLTYTGSELAHPYRDRAAPAPRGHNVQMVGNSGPRLMSGLLSEARKLGVEIRTGCRVGSLVGDGAGIVGVVAEAGEGARAIAACGGVVIATGGFHHNPVMLERYAPTLANLSPIGVTSEDGSGIRLGMAAGADVMGMEAGCIILPYAKPRKLTKGILVNASGQRFINEDVYQAIHGDVAVHGQSGHAFCIADAEVFGEPLMPHPVIGPFDSMEELERALELPEGSLVQTWKTYNAHAARGEDPLFHKSSEWVEPLDRPPYRALDLRVSSFPYPFFTLGGLRTTPRGEVLTAEGETLEGLYAAGRATSGIPARGYSSGVSLADATFFGRLAGRSAAERARSS